MVTVTIPTPPPPTVTRVIPHDKKTVSYVAGMPRGTAQHDGEVSGTTGVPYQGVRHEGARNSVPSQLMHVDTVVCPRPSKMAKVENDCGPDGERAGHVSAGLGPALPPPPLPPSPVFPRVLRPVGFSYACPKHGKNHRWTMLDPCPDCIRAAEEASLRLAP